MIHILCSSDDHPVNAWLEPWADANDARILRSASELTGGDFLFLISCSEIVTAKHRAGYRHTLVIHASDLPNGRGWSPYVWEILAGADHVTVTLLDAQDPVDSGKVWRKLKLPLDGTELVDEINAKLFVAEIELMDWALAHCDHETPEPQVGEATYWPRRTPGDSQITADQTIGEVFDLLRVSDPDRYPAFFDHRGARYVLSLRKLPS